MERLTIFMPLVGGIGRLVESPLNSHMITYYIIVGLLSNPKTCILLGAIKISPKDDATQRIDVEKYIIVSTYLRLRGSDILRIWQMANHKYIDEWVM